MCTEKPMDTSAPGIHMCFCAIGVHDMQFIENLLLDAWEHNVI